MCIIAIHPGRLLIDWLPILEKLPLRFQPWLKLADSLYAREYAVNLRFLKLLRKQIAAGTEPACFGIDAIEHQKKQGFDDVLLVDLLAGIVFAGSETTATMMQSFMKAIAMHPEVQQKAHEGTHMRSSKFYCNIQLHLLKVLYRARPHCWAVSSANI